MPPAVEAALAALAARVERLHQDTGEQEALRRLQAEVHSIGRKIDSAASLQVSENDGIALDRIRNIETKLDMLQTAPTELARRLDHIQQLVQSSTAAAGVPQGLEALLGNLAMRMETMQSSPVDDRTLDRLHHDIRQISEKLEANPAAQHMPGVADMGGLERSISELFGPAAAVRGEIGTTAEQAARRAADEVINQSGREGANDERVRRQLSAFMRRSRMRSGAPMRRSGAVHETLTRVVDRLVDLEQDIKVRPAASTAPVMPPQPLPPLGAPPSLEMPRFPRRRPARRPADEHRRAAQPAPRRFRADGCSEAVGKPESARCSPPPAAPSPA